MKGAAVILFLVGGAGVLFWGCRPAAARRFSFSVPAGWKKVDTVLSGMRLEAVMSPDTTGRVRPNVSVTVEQMGGGSLVNYFNANVRRISGSLARFRMVAKGEKTIGGMPAMWIDFTGQMANKVELEQRLYIAVDGVTAYLITCTAASGGWAKGAPGFDVVLDSFTID